MHPSTWTKPQVLLRCITIAVIGFGCASSHLREPVVVMSPQDIEDLVSIHLAACRILADPVCNIKVQWDSGKQIQGMCLHALSLDNTSMLFLKSDSILKLWCTDHGMSPFLNCKAWHIRLQLGWLLAINGFFAHSAACNKQKRIFLFFLPFVCFDQFVLFIEWQRETTHMFQLCVPSEFRPKVGPQSFFSVGQLKYIHNYIGLSCCGTPSSLEFIHVYPMSHHMDYTQYMFPMQSLQPIPRDGSPVLHTVLWESILQQLSGTVVIFSAFWGGSRRITAGVRKSPRMSLSLATPAPSHCGTFQDRWDKRMNLGCQKGLEVFGNAQRFFLQIELF